MSLKEPHLYENANFALPAGVMGIIGNNGTDKTTLAQRHPQSLSGGEKQRLVIACGLASKPDIFILDEPTSGVDGRNMERISKMIRQAADDGVSVVVITHDLELLSRVCDTALRLPFPPDLSFFLVVKIQLPGY